MNVLVACEFSGRVRDAFTARGHFAVSCDFLESETPGHHIVGDVLDILYCNPWDLMIAHPPCTYLANSVARWWKGRKEEQEAAIEFFMHLWRCGIPKIAIENPIGLMSTRFRKPDQIIQPWMFGHGETKATCLWLKGLPKLVPNNIVSGRADRIHKMPESKDRWKNRSRTYEGIAKAMAEQWG